MRLSIQELMRALVSTLEQCLQYIVVLSSWPTAKAPTAPVAMMRRGKASTGSAWISCLTRRCHGGPPGPPSAANSSRNRCRRRSPLSRVGPLSATDRPLVSRPAIETSKMSQLVNCEDKTYVASDMFLKQSQTLSDRYTKVIRK